jgi:hypothetical protein
MPLEKEIIDSFATQVHLSATVVLMRDINQKASDTDKQITIALRRSVWLSYLLSLGAISAGGLSILSVGAILGTKPAQANMKEQTASLPAQTVEEEPALHTSAPSSDYTFPAAYHQDLVNGEPSQTAEGDFQTTADITRSKQQPDRLNIKALDASVALTSNDKALQDLYRKDDADPEVSQAQPEQAVLAPTQRSIARIPVFTPKSLPQATEFNFEPPLLAQPKPTTVAAVNAAVPVNLLSLVPTKATPDNGKLLAQFSAGDKPTTVVPDFASLPTKEAPALNSVERNVPEQLAVGDEPTTVQVRQASDTTKEAPALNSVERNVPGQLAVRDEPTTAVSAKVPSPLKEAPAVYKGPGGASLLGGNLQAQTSEEGKPPSSSPSQNSPQINNPLAPSLTFQGAVLNQGDTSARARVTGIYPISPNALFGGTVDLTTGNGFSDSAGGGLQLNELYFTGSLPSLPNLRLTTGLVDLTSYFDRNSFAKDSTTHFFNPVFQTNPALAATGISSRPAALLNWDVTDNLQARAAAFSSHRNLGDFALDGFAGEVAFRTGNAIIRGTFASDRDAGRNNGFKEIYGIPRDNGETGLRSGDRENAYGINAEYFIPQLKMGVFGRYGRYENTSLGKGGDTYSLGLNFLDLFMRDDRLGFGYGRDLSNNDLRRQSGNKVPDVWELFYDARVLPNLRAGVTLQARDEFSDVVAGFRVKTEFDLLGRLFR